MSKVNGTWVQFTCRAVLTFPNFWEVAFFPYFEGFLLNLFCLSKTTLRFNFCVSADARRVGSRDGLIEKLWWSRYKAGTDFKDKRCTKPHKTLASILWIQMYIERLLKISYIYLCNFNVTVASFFLKFVLNVVIFIYGMFLIYDGL